MLNMMNINEAPDADMDHRSHTEDTNGEFWRWVHEDLSDPGFIVVWTYTRWYRGIQ